MALAFATSPQLNQSLGYEDHYLNETVKFYRMWSSKGNNTLTSRKFPALYEATQIHMNSRPGGYRWLVEAALMTSSTDEEIAELFAFRYGSDTVHAFRRVYFDIDAYRSKKAVVFCNVLSTSLANLRGPEDYDFTWKVFCYEHGKDGLAALIDFHTGAPFNKKYLTYFKNMTNSRLSYNSFHVSTLSQSHRESAMRTLENAQQMWNFDKNQDRGSGAQYEAAKQILEACRDAILSPGIEDIIQSTTDSWEGQLEVDYNDLPVTE